MIYRISIIVFVFIAATALIARFSFEPVQRLITPIAELFFSKGVLRIPADQTDKYVVLTIDDAPSSRTKEILDLLDQYDATATFFVHTDQIAGADRQAAMMRIGADGHDIGHHMARDRKTTKLSRAEFETEFSSVALNLQVYEGARGFFRPPHGAYKTNTMDPALVKYGYDKPMGALDSERRYILASFIPWDAGGATNTADADHNKRVGVQYAQKLLDNIYPGAIVVFHDGEEGNREARLEATLHSLEHFLKGATHAGFDVVSFSDGAVCHRPKTTE